MQQDKSSVYIDQTKFYKIFMIKIYNKKAKISFSMNNSKSILVIFIFIIVLKTTTRY